MRPAEARWKSEDDPERHAAWARAWKASISVRIITGDVEYQKDLPAKYKPWRLEIWKAGVETFKQLDSEQYILSRGFKKVLDKFLEER